MGHVGVKWPIWTDHWLVGGFNPFGKYWSNLIISPSKGENKQNLKPTPSWSKLKITQRDIGTLVHHFGPNLFVLVSTETPGILVLHNEFSQVNLAGIWQKNRLTFCISCLSQTSLRKVEHKFQAPKKRLMLFNYIISQCRDIYWSKPTKFQSHQPMNVLVEFLASISSLNKVIRWSVIVGGFNCARV